MGNATIIGPLGSSDIELPFFSFRVPAGFESPANDHLESRISLDALLDIDAPQTYLVRADGESMTGVGIFDGDLLVVNRALDPASGEVVIAAINGEPVVKTFFRDDSQLVLRSENPKYPPRYVLEGDELTIWGVVISSIRKHRCYG